MLICVQRLEIVLHSGPKAVGLGRYPGMYSAGAYYLGPRDTSKSVNFQKFVCLKYGKESPYT